MYLWLVKQTAQQSIAGTITISRFVLTSSRHPDDALFRLKEAYQTEGEMLKEINLIGSIPAIQETYAATTGRPKILYVKFAYVLPLDPSGSTNVRRVVTEYFDRMDRNAAIALGVEDVVGAIATGPGDAVEVAMMGVIVATTDDSPEGARQVIESHIFQGIVREADIRIMQMKRIAPDGL